MKHSRILRAMALVIALFAGDVAGNARILEEKDLVPGIDQRDTAVTAMRDRVLNRYGAWTDVEFNGRVSIPGVSVKPSVRMYMEKDSLIQISVRVPLLGEVGRLDLTPGSMRIVNRMNRTYCEESMSRLMEMYPGLIDDIQSVMLGRMVVLGSGELSIRNLGEVFFDLRDGNRWFVLPYEMPGQGKINYVYRLLDNGRTELLWMDVPGAGIEAMLGYGYSSGAMSMTVDVDAGKKKYNGTLEFSSVRWGGSPMPDISLGKYARKGIGDFFRNLL